MPNLLSIAPLRDAFIEYRKSYTSMGSDYSVTSLIRSPRQVHLQKRHAKFFDGQPITSEEIESKLQSFMGEGLHRQFEFFLRLFINRNQGSGYTLESRIWDRICDRKISGKFDCLLNGALYDFKSTSVWKHIMGDHTEWEQQLNLYNYLLHTCKQEVKIMFIIAWFTDYDKKKIWDEGYPDCRVQQYHIDKIWPRSQQEEYLHHRIELMKANEDRPDDELDPCTPEEMWEKPTVYAVLRPGAARAVRAKGMDTEEIAKNYIANSKAKDKDTFTIECRPGDRTKCANWCKYNRFCNQYQEYKAATNGVA